jgi:branched-chain amino acid transport system substrate-binding protein
VAVLAAACGGSSSGGSSSGGSSSAPYKVGFVSSITGPVAALGAPQVAGFQTYINYVNSQGGVNGHKIDLTVKDDQFQVADGVLAVKSFVNNHDIAIVGPFSSAIIPAAVPAAQQAKIPSITLSIVDALSGNPPAPYVYGIDIDLSDQAAVMAKFLTTKLADENHTQYKRIATVGFESPSTQSFQDELKQNLPGMGASLVKALQVPPTTTDLSASARSTLAAKPDAYLLSLSGAQPDAFLKVLRLNGFKGPIVEDGAGSSDAVLETANDPDFYVLRDYLPPNSDNPAAATMRERATAAGQARGETDGKFTNGYVAAWTLVDALQRCGSNCTTETLNAALQNTNLDTQGLSGPISASSTNNRFVQTALLAKWDPKTKKSVAVSDFLAP